MAMILIITLRKHSLKPLYASALGGSTRRKISANVLCLVAVEASEEKEGRNKKLNQDAEVGR